MAGKIIADTIESAGSQISLNVGNVTILTASSTGLTLIPTTNVNVNLTNSIVTLTNGSATSPGLTFSGNTRTGLFMPSANTLAFTAANTESMRIDSAGNVGIGTSSPAGGYYKLHINAAASLLANGTTGAGYWQYGNNATASNNWHCGSEGDGTFRWYNGIYGSGTERMRIDSSGNLSFNSGYGSVATAYGCRAWVNFNGTGVVAIRASGNVSSITDNGTGDYTVNFATAMADANYAVNLTSRITAINIAPVVANLLTTTTPTASLFRMVTDRNGVGVVDPDYVFASVFR